MIENLKIEISEYRDQLMTHPIYGNINSIYNLKQFMESHVYAVWDFMSLVKKLQLDLTTTSLPWQPPNNNSAAGLINEIVWGKKRLDKYGNSVSHFEMYLNAMKQIDADTGGIEKLLSQLGEGQNIFDAIDQARLPAHVGDFLNFTFRIIEEGKIHKIAAVFSLLGGKT